MFRMLATIGFLSVAPTAPAQSLETQATTGGGAHSASPTHQMWSSCGQTTPLAPEPLAISNATHAVQPGLIPTLYPRRLLGDVNGDLRVDAVDIVKTANHDQEPARWPMTIQQQFDADVNTDLKIDSTDVEGIADIIVGRN